MVGRLIKVAGAVLFLSGAALTASQGGTSTADVAKGERLYHVRGCVGCHEALGSAAHDTLIPLSGSVNDHRLALRSYRSGLGSHPTLSQPASRLSDDEIVHTAAFLGIHAPANR